MRIWPNFRSTLFFLTKGKNRTFSLSENSLWLETITNGNIHTNYSIKMLNRKWESFFPTAFARSQYLNLVCFELLCILYKYQNFYGDFFFRSFVVCVRPFALKIRWENHQCIGSMWIYYRYGAHLVAYECVWGACLNTLSSYCNILRPRFL